MRAGAMDLDDDGEMERLLEEQRQFLATQQGNSSSSGTAAKVVRMPTGSSISRGVVEKDVVSLGDLAVPTTRAGAQPQPAKKKVSRFKAMMAAKEAKEREERAKAANTSSSGSSTTDQKKDDRTGKDEMEEIPTILREVAERDVQKGGRSTQMSHTPTHPGGFPTPLQFHRKGEKPASVSLSSSSSSGVTTGNQRGDVPSKASVLVSGSGILTEKDVVSIHTQNEAKIEGMSEEEIAQAQQELLASLSPDLVRMLQSRNSGAPAPEKSSRSKPAERTATSQPDETEPKSKAERKTETAAGSSSVYDPLVTLKEQLKAKESLYAGSVEKGAAMALNEVQDTRKKIQWMEAVKKDKGREDGVYSMRFDFHGAEITADTAVPVHRGLHHHGDDPLKPGYTLSELLYLSRSTVPAQRVAGLRTLSRVLRRCLGGNREEAFPPVVRNKILQVCVEFDLVSFIRTSLDDAQETVTAAAVDCVHSLCSRSSSISDDGGNESTVSRFPIPLRSTLDIHIPTAAPNMSSERKEARTDEEEEDEKKVHVVERLVGMDLLNRVRYLLEVVAVPAKNDALHMKLLDILFSVASHSRMTATAIHATPRLLEVLLDIRYDLDGAPPVWLAKRLELLVTISKSAHSLCSSIVRQGGLDTVLRVITVCEGMGEGGVPASVVPAVIHALELFQVVTAYSIPHHMLAHILPVLSSIVSQKPQTLLFGPRTYDYTRIAVASLTCVENLLQSANAQKLSVSEECVPFNLVAACVDAVIVSLTPLVFDPAAASKEKQNLLCPLLAASFSLLATYMQVAKDREEVDESHFVAQRTLLTRKFFVSWRRSLILKTVIRHVRTVPPVGAAAAVVPSATTSSGSISGPEKAPSGNKETKVDDAELAQLKRAVVDSIPIHTSFTPHHAIETSPGFKHEVAAKYARFLSSMLSSDLGALMDSNLFQMFHLCVGTVAVHMDAEAVKSYEVVMAFEMLQVFSAVLKLSQVNESTAAASGLGAPSLTRFRSAPVTSLGRKAAMPTSPDILSPIPIYEYALSTLTLLGRLPGSHEMAKELLFNTILDASLLQSVLGDSKEDRLLSLAAPDICETCKAVFNQCLRLSAGISRKSLFVVPEPTFSTPLWYAVPFPEAAFARTAEETVIPFATVYDRATHLLMFLNVVVRFDVVDVAVCMRAALHLYRLPSQVFSNTGVVRQVESLRRTFVDAQVSLANRAANEVLLTVYETLDVLLDRYAEDSMGDPVFSSMFYLFFLPQLAAKHRLRILNAFIDKLSLLDVPLPLPLDRLCSKPETDKGVLELYGRVLLDDSVMSTHPLFLISRHHISLLVQDGRLPITIGSSDEERARIISSINSSK